MASRGEPIVTQRVALPPYTWQMTKERAGTVWGVDLRVSDDRVVLLSAYRSLGGRWTWTVLLHRITKKGLAYDSRIARGIAGTLTAAKPAAEAPPGTGCSISWDWTPMTLTEHAGPLMPPLLIEVLGACPTTTAWKTRTDEPSLTGARDRALLLLGFVSAMRPSEIAALTLDQITPDDRGRVIQLTHSNTNHRGVPDHVVLPRGSRQDTCPIAALDHWLQLGGITGGPVFRKITKGNKATDTALTADGLSRVVTGAVGRAGYDPTGYSGRSLRAGFATYAIQRGATAQQVAHQTRHKSLVTLGVYTRIEDAWEDNAATRLGL